MLFRVFMLLSLYAASAYGQGFVCGYEPSGDEVSRASSRSSHAGDYRSSTAADPIKVLILFGKFPGETHSSGNPLENAIQLDTYTFTGRDNTTANTKLKSAALVDPTIEGSLAHYFQEMSYENLHLASANVEAQKRWYDGSANPNLPTTCSRNTWWNAVSNFTRDVLANADADVNFADADVVAVLTPPRMGAPNDADGECNYNGTVLESPGFSWTSNDVDSAGTQVVVDKVITSDRSHRFPFIVGVLAHEYGHVMELPELFDRTSQTSPNDHARHSAGIGYWGVMGRGAAGYWDLRDGISVGPAPMTAWSRIEVGWLDGRVNTVSSDEDVTLPDINSDTDEVVVQIPVSSDEYFLLSNRQRGDTGSYYDDYAPASGLLIWHVDESAQRYSNDANEFEEHKRVDVECADGLREDTTPLPSPTAIFRDNSISGGDDLDYYTADDDYRTSRGGNIGDADDVWTPESDDFTPDSNPSTHGYSGSGSSAQQTEFTGIAVRGITQNTTDGSVRVQIRFIPDAPTVSGAPVQGTGDDWNQVTLSFIAPDVNTAVIRGYEYSINNGDWRSAWSPPAPTPGAGLRTGTISLPTDDNTVNYTFQVRAETTNGEQGEAAAWSAFTFDRPGSVSLMLPADKTLTTLTVGDQLTATFSDANGVITDSDSWAWERGAVSNGSWTGTPIIGATDTLYELTAADVGQQVRATVRYTDGAGANTDTAASEPTGLVQHLPPPVPSKALRATSDFTALLVKWPAVAATPAVDRYQLQFQSKPAEATQQAQRDAPESSWPEPWTVIDAAISATPVGSPYVYTHAGLDSGRLYRYQLRAHNAGGWSGWSKAFSIWEAGWHEAVDRKESHGAQPKPGAPPNLKAVAGPEQVRLGWDLLSDATIEGYAYRYRIKGSPIVWLQAWTSGADTTAGTQTIGGLSGGKTYIFQVRAVNPAGAGKPAKAEQKPQAANRAPVVAGEQAASVDEEIALVGPYTATDADGDAIEWQALAGADASVFELTGAVTDTTRTLQFTAAPNYEQPADADGDSVYAVALIATDTGTPPLADTLEVSVQVTDVDDPGTLVLSSLTPQVGDNLTATLTDEDVPLVLVSDSWHWSLFHDSEVSGFNGPDRAERSQTLPVSTVYLGSRLLARVSYQDRHGAQSAHSDTTAAVVGPPWPPQGLTAVPGDGQVGLRWTAPLRTGGSAILRYESWYSGEGGGAVVGGGGRVFGR